MAKILSEGILYDAHGNVILDLTQDPAVLTVPEQLTFLPVTTVPSGTGALSFDGANLWMGNGSTALVPPVVASVQNVSVPSGSTTTLLTYTPPAQANFLIGMSTTLPSGTPNGVTATITVGTNPRGVGVNPSTNTIYVANYGSNSVSVIDGSTNVVTATITVGTDPYGVGVNPSTNTIYVANDGSSSVSVIDGATNAVTATITVGTDPIGVAVNPSTNTIYVANYVNGTVSVIDGSTNAVTATITVGTYPYGVAVNPSTNTIYVANEGSASVSVITLGISVSLLVSYTDASGTAASLSVLESNTAFSGVHCVNALADAITVQCQNISAAACIAAATIYHA